MLETTNELGLFYITWDLGIAVVQNIFMSFNFTYKAFVCNHRLLEKINKSY